MNKIFSIFALIIFPTLAVASPLQFGRIVDIKGSGFISFDGQTHEIKKGEVIYANSEIIIEHSGQVIFTDNADHKFHLGNASSAAVFAGKVELRNGDIWLQSINKTDEYLLTSANASVSYTGGEAIVSYNSMKGKTQLMVINGLMKLANLRSPELNLSVAEGNFSFVDPAFEAGMPRDPTPVGEKTYGQLVGMFPGVSPMDKHSADIFKNEHGAKVVERSIASVPEAPLHSAVIELENEYKADVMKLSSKKVVSQPAKKRSVVLKAHKVNEKVIKIYGLSNSDHSSTTAIYDIPKSNSNSNSNSKRAPASFSEIKSGSIIDQAVPNDDLNTNSAIPQNKESSKLLDQLNKL